MCGRFSIYSPLAEIERRFSARFDTDDSISAENGYSPRFNAAPMQYLPIITNDSPGSIVMARWGFLPIWSKDESMAGRMINARAEGISEKKSFKHYFLEKRCLIPANNFFEWSKSDKQPYLVKAKDDLFAFAGLWSVWKDKKGNEIRTFTIITASANKKIGKIHDRMPVILNRSSEKQWLSNPNESLLKPLSNAETILYPISKAVNKPENNYREILEKVSGMERQSGLGSF